METTPNSQPVFDTPRCVLSPLGPTIARHLAEVLLQEDASDGSMPWQEGGTRAELQADVAGMEAETECGMCRMWSIMTRDDEAVVGALIARNGVDGIDVEVVLDAGIELADLADEVCPPVMAWLQANTGAVRVPSYTLH